MQGYILLLLSDLLLAASFCIKKIYQKVQGATLKSGLYFNMLSSICSIILFLSLNGFAFNITPFSLLMATLACIVGTLYTMIGFYIMKSGTMALYTMFLMTGGMIVPYIWGLIFLGENFSLLRTAALVLIIMAVIVSNYNGKKTDKKQFIMCASVFLLNGFVSVFNKVHQVEKNFITVSTTEYALLGSLVKFVLTGVIYAIVCAKMKDTEPKKPLKIKILIPAMIALMACIGGVSSLLQLKGAVNIPATVLYPFITGGSIVFTSLAGVIFFKDKLSKRIIFSVILCVIGTILFL